MQTIIDISDSHAKRLKDIATEQKISESRLMQQIIVKWLQQQPAPLPNDNIKKGFGLWADNTNVSDGVSYQNQIRNEW